MCTIIQHTSMKQRSSFLVGKSTEFVNQMFGDFVKMTLAWFPNHWLWLESSHSVKMWLEWSLRNIRSQRDSSHQIS